MHEDLPKDYELDEKDMATLSKIESKSVALRFLKRFPKKVAKPAPKKKVPAKKVKVEEKKGDE